MKNTFNLRKFLTENKAPLINEFQGSGKIGKLKPMSARELSLLIDELDKSGLHIEDRPTSDIGEFTKTYRQYTIRLNGPDDNNGAFTIYDYKLGFDPNAYGRSNDEVEFHVGGAGRSSINNAKVELGDLFIPDARNISEEEEDREDMNEPTELEKLIQKSEKTRKEMEDASKAKNETAPGYLHDCAAHVVHETYGYGICLEGRHTLVETSKGRAKVTHYDVFFKNGSKIVENIPVEDLVIESIEEHHHGKRKK